MFTGSGALSLPVQKKKSHSQIPLSKLLFDMATILTEICELAPLACVAIPYRYVVLFYFVPLRLVSFFPSVWLLVVLIVLPI